MCGWTGRVVLVYGLLVLVAVLGFEGIRRWEGYRVNELMCMQGDTSSPSHGVASAYNPFPSRCEWNQALLSPSQVTLKYHCDLDSCDTLNMDQQTANWIGSALQQRRSALATELSHLISRLPSSNQYVSKALFDSPQLHMLSSNQWRSFLTYETASLFGPNWTALDVGGGNGDVTKHFSSMYGELWMADVSPLISARQRLNGFRNTIVSYTVTEDLLAGYSVPDIDIVFLLNVIDQLEDPAAYLRQLVRSFSMQRKPPLLVLSVPLPWNAWQSRHRFPVNGTTWEASITSLQSLLLQVGLRTLKLTRAPYLCQGTYQVPLFVLDSALFILSST